MNITQDNDDAPLNQDIGLLLGRFLCVLKILNCRRRKKPFRKHEEGGWSERDRHTKEDRGSKIPGSNIG